MPNLRSEDYVNLLRLIDGETPLWDIEALRRCAREGLVTPTGRFLTQEGHRKATILQSYVRKLEVGLPLSARTISRSYQMWNECWNRTTYKDEQCFFNSQAVFRGQPPTPFRRSCPKTENAILRSDLNGLLMSDQNSFRKLIPYAVQIDKFGHHEYVCLKSVVKNDYFRIQSKYYDYCVETYSNSNVSFWFRTARDGAIIVKGGPTMVGFKDGIVAFIKTCELNRSYPLNGTSKA